MIARTLADAEREGWHHGKSTDGSVTVVVTPSTSTRFRGRTLTDTVVHWCGWVGKTYTPSQSDFYADAVRNLRLMAMGKGPR